jgi:hypothetical protein
LLLKLKLSNLKIFLKLNSIPSSQVNPNAKVGSEGGECKTSGEGGVDSMREVEGLVGGREVGRRSPKKLGSGVVGEK